jgi:hypothetical protein
MCDKPIAARFWDFADVAGHWDRLILRSYAVEGDRTTLYQEGPVTAMLDPAALLAGYVEGGVLPEDTLMFCGTLAALGGVRPAACFEFELEDPVLGREIRHGYDVLTLPVLG